ENSARGNPATRADGRTGIWLSPCSPMTCVKRWQRQSRSVPQVGGESATCQEMFPSQSLDRQEVRTTSMLQMSEHRLDSMQSAEFRWDSADKRHRRGRAVSLPCRVALRFAPSDLTG